MNTVDDLLKKFNLKLNLKENVKNHDIGIDLNIIDEYYTEQYENRTIHVFNGIINDGNTEIEYILDLKDDEVILTYFGKHKYQDKKVLKKQTRFNDKLSITART